MVIGLDIVAAVAEDRMHQCAAVVCTGRDDDLSAEHHDVHQPNRATEAAIK
jgi:hypothetical protein